MRCGDASRPPRPTSSSSRSRAGSRRTGRSRSRREIERIAAACAVADRALATLLPRIVAGRHGAVAGARAGVAAADGRRGGGRVRSDLPRRARRRRCRTARPGDAARRARRRRAVRLRCPGRRLPQRHDPDAVRRRADRARPRGLRARGGAHSAAAIDQLRGGARAPRWTCRPAATSTRIARGVIEADGRWPAYGHGLGHGIGLATHELPVARADPRPTRRCRRRRSSASSPGSTSRARPASGSRTSCMLDAGAGRLERLTQFPRDVARRRRMRPAGAIDRSATIRRHHDADRASSRPTADPPSACTRSPPPT